MKKKRILIVIIIIILLGFIFIKDSNKIDNVLKTEEYKYLPKVAKEYIKEVYDNTGEIILTEKNKINDQPYLNPEYVKYLENGSASEYGYVPETFTIEHSYIDDNNIKHKQNKESLISAPYYNLRDDNHITNVYDQGDSGLCWAFASSTSLESHISIKTNNEKKYVFSEKQVDYATTINGTLDIGNNPYISENSYVVAQYLDDGGNMLRYINSAAIGVSPVECDGDCSLNTNYNSDNHITNDKYWKYNLNYNKPLSPYEIINFDNTDYSVDEMLFFNPLVSENETEVNALVQILKNQIVNNGSLYVGVGAYTNTSVEYIPKNGEKVYNKNGKNIIYYIPYKWKNNIDTNHAVSLIGWDDNYTHNVCLNNNIIKITDAILNADGSYSCSSSSEVLHKIEGAWILQNSWGDYDTYIYLPYNSMKSVYSGISKVSEKDFDNAYRAKERITYFEKGNTPEILSKVKLLVSAYNQTIKIYYNTDDKEIIVNDGSKTTNGTLLKNISTTYPGVYTIDLLDKNIVFNNEIKLTFATNDTDYYHYASLHTNNVTNDKYIDIFEISKLDEKILAKCSLNDNKCIEQEENISFKDNNAFLIQGITRGLTSNDNLTFKIINSKNVDVTNLFHIFRNYSVSNYLNTLISYNDDDIELGTYTIEVYYNETKYDILEWNLDKHNNIMDGIGTKNNPHIIKTSIELNDIRNHISNNIIEGYYELANDIDLSYDTKNSKGLFYNQGLGWEPINNFAGNFNGNNYMINGLNINRTTTNNIGLFGNVYGVNNYIKNIILKNVSIHGNTIVGSLIGGIYESKGIDIHDIAIINGSITSSNQTIGGIIGTIQVKYNSNYKFYNLFNNAKVGQSNANNTGGIIGTITKIDIWDSTNNKWISPQYDVTLTDIINLGKVSGGNGKTGGIVADINGSNKLIIKNIISAGEYTNTKDGDIGDISGNISNINSLTINNTKYLDRIYGDNVSINNGNTTNNNIIIFKDIITNNYINSFEYKNSWINPNIDNIKRIPMLKTMVKYFDFTEVKSPIEININSRINIKDKIKPNIEEVKNIKYTYNEEYITIDSNGIIIPNKIGTTTLGIESLYDGYTSNIDIIIRDKINITYNSNNSNNNIKIQKVEYKTEFSLDKNLFEYKGHLFKNWNTLKDGTGTTYTDEQLFTEGITQDLELYAQWEPITYEVTFDSNGGIGTMEKQFIVYGKDTVLSSSKFTKDGYRFKNWNTLKDGTGITYENRQVITLDKNITLYAQWELLEGFNINNYTISDNKYIEGIEPSTSIDNFITNILLDDEYTIEVDYKMVNNEKLVYTGGKTRIYKNGTLYIEYINVVRGDVNGNGIIDIIDYIRIMKHIMNEIILIDDIYLAADVNQNDKIDIIDYIRIMKMIMEESE